MCGCLQCMAKLVREKHHARLELDARACMSVRENEVGEDERDGSGYCRGEPSPGSDVARAGAVPMQTWHREPSAGPDVVEVSPCISVAGAQQRGTRRRSRPRRIAWASRRGPSPSGCAPRSPTLHIHATRCNPAQRGAARCNGLQPGTARCNTHHAFCTAACNAQHAARWRREACAHPGLLTLLVDATCSSNTQDASRCMRREAFA